MLSALQLKYHGGPHFLLGEQGMLLGVAGIAMMEIGNERGGEDCYDPIYCTVPYVTGFALFKCQQP